jgi:hypothetical protein
MDAAASEMDVRPKASECEDVWIGHTVRDAERTTVHAHESATEVWYAGGW